MRRYGNTRFDMYGGALLKEGRAREKAVGQREVEEQIDIKDDTEMKPIYIPQYVQVPSADILNEWIDGLHWLQETPARKECFMSPEGGVSYTYGTGRWARTYVSIKMDECVAVILKNVNQLGYSLDGAFLNLYENDHNALGWHSDDFEGMNHLEPVAVVSFGEPREIWWQPIGAKGVVPLEQRQLLEPGSVFVMPAGFQHHFEHKIPKGSRAMGRRVSITFRAFK